MSETSASDGFRTALAIFDAHAPAVMTIDLNIKGKAGRWDLQHLLSLGDAFDDPTTLNMMADKLPSMLVFFGLALVQAQEMQASLEEELDLFMQGKWQGALEALTLKIDELKDADGKKVVASLKKAPTTEAVRAAIITENSAVLGDLKARKVTADREVRVLENIYKGIELRIRLLNSQMSVTNSMVLKGIGR